MAESLYLDNDLEVQYTITRRATTTGAIQAAAGLTGLTCHLAATPQGAAIHADLSVSAAERSATAGTYYALFEGDELTTHLTSYANRTVFAVLTNNNDDVEAILPLVVRESRLL